jgi:site-specific DNA-methyltransferase (adenine-specific)
MGKVFKECERVLKDNGSFYFFHNDFLQIVELQNFINKNTGFIFKQLITWNKIHEKFKNYGYVQRRLSVDSMRNYYNGFTEYCLYYTLQEETGLKSIDEKYIIPRNPFRKIIEDAKQKTGMTTIQIAEMGGFYGKVNHGGSVSNWLKGVNIPTKEQYEKMKTFLPLKEEYKKLKVEYEKLREEYEKERYTFNNSRVKDDLRGNSNVWLYPPSKKNGHITPKPTVLLENIIKHSSNKGDTVLDCFMGSGSVGIACINTNRKFIGIEKDDNYFEIAKKRIEEHGNG